MKIFNSLILALAFNYFSYLPAHPNDVSEHNTQKNVQERDRPASEKVLQGGIKRMIDFYRDGKILEAVNFGKQLLSVAIKKLGFQNDSVLLLSDGLSVVLSAQGRYAEAEALKKKVLDARIMKYGWENKNTIDSALDLMIIYINLKRHLKAENLYFKTMLLSEIYLNKIQSTRLTQIRLSILAESGEISNEEDLLKDITRSYSKILGDSHELTISSQNNLAAFYSEIGRYQQSEEILKNIISLKGEIHSKDELLNLAHLHMKQEKFKDSIGVSKDLIKIFDGKYAINDEIVIDANVLISRNYALQLHYLKASEHLENALNLARRRKIRETSKTIKKNSIEIRAMSAQAVQSFALSLVEEASLIGKDMSNIAFHSILSMKGIEGEYDSALRRASAQGDVRAQNLVVELRRHWAQFTSKQSIGRDWFDVLERIDILEDELETLFPDLAATLELPRWPEVSNGISGSGLLLEYMLYEPVNFQSGEFNLQALHIGSVLLRPDGTTTFRPLGTVDRELEADIATLSRLNHPGSRHSQIIAAGHRLYDRLVQPFESEFKDIDQIFVSPDDVLHRIPFEVLRMRDGRFWGFEKDIQIIPTGRVLLSMGPPLENDGRFVAIGGADYGEAPVGEGRGGPLPSAFAVTLAALRSADRGKAWGPLYGAAEEVSKLSERFSASALFSGKVSPPLTGLNASEAAIRSLTGPPAILHIATHGGATDEDFALNPLSRVALGFAGVNASMQTGAEAPENDGLMRGTDIAQLNLHGTQLVTLSACKTGDGVRLRGEGVMSLAHAFRLAGVHNTLMTYWPINDDKTRDFMAEFYELWLTDLATDPHAGPAEALRSAKRRWNDRGESLKHWAAFALIQNKRAR